MVTSPSIPRPRDRCGHVRLFKRPRWPEATRFLCDRENGIVRGQEVTRRAGDPVRRRGVDGELASLREHLLPHDSQGDGVPGCVIARSEEDWPVHSNMLLLDALGGGKSDLVIRGE